ncbi:MAG: hypothetical protein NTX36_11210 [Proteobacteria bacterium]|nr:hypothetical protein [Pseudomonadota bacterium]
MKRRASSIVQHNDQWHGVSFSVTGHELSEFQIHQENTLDALKDTLKESEYAMSINTSSGYMMHFSFPFSGRRKISLIINNEMGNVLPAGIEDMATDFQEIGKGNVLSVAVPKDTISELRIDKNLNILTLNTLAILYAFKWLNVTDRKDYAFINIDGNVASIMVFQQDTLTYLRHFFYSLESNLLLETFEEILSRKELGVEAYYMFNSNGDVHLQKELIENNFNIEMNTPSLKTYIKDGDYPEWFWASVGTALLSISPKNEINLLSNKQKQASPVNRVFLIAGGGLAALGIIVVLMCYLNYFLKGRAYSYLVSEQSKIYRSVFPKAPPVKDIGRVFEDKIKSLEQDFHGAGINVSMPPLQVLAEVSSRMDNQIDIKLNEFTCDEKEFSISGTTVSFASVEKIKASLGQIKEIKNIDIQSVDIAAGKQIRFKIRGKL